MICLACSTSDAQITIPNTTFPSLGDVLHYSIDLQTPEIVMGAPGGGQVWDFTSLQPDQTLEQVFRDPLTGIYNSQFPGATLLDNSSIPGGEIYLDATDNQLRLLGIAGPVEINLGINLACNYNPPFPLRWAPLNFFDLHAPTSGVLEKFTPDMLPGEEQLPFNADSFRLRQAFSQIDAVDAWGTVILPGGSFECLRQKSTLYTESRIDAKVPPLGWLDVTYDLIQYLGYPGLGVDTTYTFRFLNDQTKEIIAHLTMDRSQLQAVNVQYKNTSIPSATETLSSIPLHLTLSPNPVQNSLHVIADDIKGSQCQLGLYTASGLNLTRQQILIDDGRLDYTLDVSALQAGIYFCRIADDRGRVGYGRFMKE